MVSQARYGIWFKFFLRPIFVYTVLHGDSARGRDQEMDTMNTKLEESARPLGNCYGGDLRSFHFLMSPPKSYFEPISGAVYGVSGANPPSAPVYFLAGLMTCFSERIQLQK